MENKKSFPERNLTMENLEILYEDNHLIAVNKPQGFWSKVIFPEIFP